MAGDGVVVALVDGGEDGLVGALDGVDLLDACDGEVGDAEVRELSFVVELGDGGQGLFDGNAVIRGV